MQLYRTLLAALLASSLAACGGSLEGDSDTSTDEDIVIVDPDDDIVIVDPGSEDAAQISYISASQSWIAIKGTGGAGRQETSIVTFQLLDVNGDAVTGSNAYTFTLTAPQGTTLEPSEGTTTTGTISTTISSGNVPGPVTVSVELDDDSSIRGVSGSLAVTTGLPDQNSLSLSVSDFSPESWNIDGVTVDVTARLADHWNNTVPDGTVVYFHTEGGNIQSVSEPVGFCTTVQGACSVQWTSSNPRPTDGRVTITAYADGEESFIDKDGDGWFSDGDIFTISDSEYFNEQTDLGEVFFDYNNNGVYDEDSEEEFVDKDTDANPLDGAYNEADGVFTGVLCSDIQESLGTCVKSLIQVRANTSIVMASSDLICAILIDDVDVTDSEIDLAVSSSLELIITDLNGNTPPADTNISVSTEIGTLSGDTEWVVPNSANLEAYTQSVVIQADGETGSGELKVSLTSPSGIESDCSVTVTSN